MKLNTNKALTLTELLISTVIIGIIMSGIITFSTSARKMQSASSKTRYTDIKLAAAMTALKKDASLATGDSTSAGILTNSGAFETICFRQDASSTPGDYSDDIWSCWMSSTSDILRRCYDPVTLPPTSVAECTAAASNRPYFALTNTNFFTVNNDGDGKLDNITLELVAHDASTAANSLTNPDVTLLTNISPLMHSR